MRAPAVSGANFGLHSRLAPMKRLVSRDKGGFYDENSPSSASNSAPASSSSTLRQVTPQVAT